MSAGPLGSRDGQAAVWTGSRFLVWGGATSPAAGENQTAVGDGATYDPATSTWQALPAAPISARWGAAAVWDGSRLFIWGGQASGYFADGATYDPARQSWSVLPPGPLSARANASALWTGSQVIVLGGYGPNVLVLGDGAVYTPSSGVWSKLPAIPGPAVIPAGATSDLVGLSAAWTGSQVVVVAIYEFHSSCGPNCGATSAHVVVAAWSPGSSSWRTLPSPPQQVSAYGSTLTWTGTQLLVVGGGICLPGMSCPVGTGGTVGELDLSTGRWTVGAEVRPTPTGPEVWTGRSLVLFGSGGVNSSTNGMATDLTQLYDPAAQEWRQLPSPNVQYVRGASAEWTGGAILLWAGNSGASPQFLSYTPANPTPSNGGTQTSPSQAVTVPDVVGQNKTTAMQTLQQVGLDMRLVSQIDPQVPIGTVISEAPAPGSQMPRGGEVTVTVSSEGTPLNTVDWTAVSYPVNCGGTTVGTVAGYPEPTTGREVAVVYVQCVHGAGSPPSAVLVYDYATSARTPHLLQTLLSYQDDWSPASNGYSSSGAQLSIEVYGYTGSAPRCCPNVHTTLHWTWTGTTYRETSSEPTHDTLPG